MPEGPTIFILKEELQPFIGKKIIKVEGNSKLDIQRLQDKKINDIKSWGKHLLFCFNDFTLRIHFMLFGSYRINEKKEAPARLSLQFKKGEINFYACSVKFIEEDINDVYDWTADVMSETFDEKKALKKLKEIPGTMVCDALLNQQIFSGVGNIIKNEVLFRIKIHPESLVGKLPLKQKKILVKEAVNYSYDFLKWKRKFELRKHWLAHTKKICPRDKIPFHKKYLGKTNRRSFFCDVCQVLYD